VSGIMFTGTARFSCYRLGNCRRYPRKVSYYTTLQPDIARAYRLRYDEEARATQAEEGYFWREAPDSSQLRSGA
jgi:hypothetical protein